MKKHNLVLVPGLMCDHSAWDPMLEGLRSVAYCQIIDHGQARSLVVATLLLAVANAIIRPIAVFLTLPLTIITLGQKRQGCLFN